MAHFTWLMSRVTAITKTPEHHYLTHPFFPNYLNEKRAALLSDLTKKHNRALMAQGGNGNLYETVDNMFEWHENLVDLLEQKAFGEVLARLADSTDAHIKKYAIALGIRTDAPQMRGVIKSLAQSPDFKNLIATETARKAQ